MEQRFFFDDIPADPIDRVDGRAKVTGTATYAAEYKTAKPVYGFLVGSTITKGRITSIDTKAAERAPGVLAVITYANRPEIPGLPNGTDTKLNSGQQALRIFGSDEIKYFDQPIALVIADTYERVLFAAKQIKATYNKEEPQTDFHANLSKAKAPGRGEDYKRGEAEAYKNAEVIIEREYAQPIEVHNPMELANIIAEWTAEDKVTVYTKTQGVQSTQRTISDAFKLPANNVTVHGEYVGGAFGMALKTWPYEIAAVMGAKKAGRPLKLVLHREQMFTNVGYRPAAVQKIGLGAKKDGTLTGITHEATAVTSSYENFTEGIVSVTQFLYECANVNTKYRIVPLDVSTPIWMRGPGEATGVFALESAMDELAYELHMDPIEFRLKNHADKDPERNRPFSSKYLKDCYALGSERIGWKNRKMQPRSIREGDWLVGYGMGTGTFGAGRRGTNIRAVMKNDGSLLLQSSVNDMGPGTATMMTAIAAEQMHMQPKQIKVEMGSTGLPAGPTQGGSTVTSVVGSAVYEVCMKLKEQIAGLAAKTSSFSNTKADDLNFSGDGIALRSNASVNMRYADLFKQTNTPNIDITHETKVDQQPYSMYSFSVHFIKLRVNPRIGKLKIDHIVSTADAGTIVSPKTAESQLLGGAVGGIGMALTEELVFDHRFGRPINNNFADYHVPVNADIPKTDILFVNKKDPYTNPMGSKGLGEISLIGMAPAIANAVFNATGKRLRELPITPDKLMEEI